MNLSLYIEFYTYLYVEIFVFIPIHIISLQHHRIYSSLCYFHIYIFLLREWETRFPSHLFGQSPCITHFPSPSHLDVLLSPLGLWLPLSGPIPAWKSFSPSLGFDNPWQNHVWIPSSPNAKLSLSLREPYPLLRGLLHQADSFQGSLLTLLGLHTLCQSFQLHRYHPHIPRALTPHACPHSTWVASLRCLVSDTAHQSTALCQVYLGLPYLITYSLGC